MRTFRIFSMFLQSANWLHSCKAFSKSWASFFSQPSCRRNTDQGLISAIQKNAEIEVSRSLRLRNRRISSTIRGSALRLFRNGSWIEQVRHIVVVDGMSYQWCLFDEFLHCAW